MHGRRDSDYINPAPARLWGLILVLVAAIAAGLAAPSPSLAEPLEQLPVEPAPIENGPPRLLTVLHDAEPQFLALLAAGKQDDAERIIATELNRFPTAQVIVDELAADNVAQAMLTNLWHRSELRAAQRTLFLQAACTRSRFDIERATPMFAAVGAINPQSPSGQCALIIVRLDSMPPTQANWPAVKGDFAALGKLVEDEQEDMMLRWLLAIECRQWNLNAWGAEQYRQILERWKPGPALVHQTYGNLLDNLKRYDEALAERRITIQQAPAHWSYDALANTLTNLHRYDEAELAHVEATRLCRRCPQYWANWAITLNHACKPDEAIEKCRCALFLDPQNQDALWNWARALEAQDKPAEALVPYRRLEKILPDSNYLKRQIARLESDLAQ
jgi:tetratricopeptide (TPR) repeat protein